ncbi:acyl-CoA dehydrogenase [Streptomyces sp. TRM43335]|uniref:Acyl-CoA dehydrogenase n=1 Tax=Streptomyces taklimakanensis TaxID=2569853 RepID=A0A6G2B8Y8_9ACTN|nr:acyl-CoA dehydrogenase family protein [Streptomyces taklimakanensis]MTE18372.1 acyl-CoA dehydrogenase [Streptomyces taklimakanensis]
MTDLLYSEIEEELRSSVRALLADRSPHQAVLARCETAEPYDRKLWRTLARDLGAASLAVPEETGGAGASVREVAVVLEELGRAAAPTPYLGSSVLAGTALLALSGDEGADELLAALASGERTATLAVPLSTAPGTPRGAGFPAAVRADSAGTLTGTVTSVADVGTADVLLVPAEGRDGPGLYAVEISAAALTVAPRTSLDLTRPLFDIALTGTAARRLAGPDRAPAALERAVLTGAGLLASEQLGLAEWCLESTVAYLRERRQFGRTLGSFQALKHRLADLWLDVVGARAAARYAAGTLADGDPDAPVAVAVAASHCGDLAVRAAEECVQLHGGIGMTWEHPAHLYLKRAKADQIALGTPDRHRTALAGLVDLPEPAPTA